MAAIIIIFLKSAILTFLSLLWVKFCHQVSVQVNYL